MICPTCGKEVPVSSVFCPYCGNRLNGTGTVSTVPTTVPTTPEDFVKNVLIRRIEGVRNRDAKTIREIVYIEKYSRFDDWPPFDLWGSEYLKNEANASKTIQGFNYETGAWRIDILGDSAIAAFVITYRGQMKNLSFNIRSRVTAYLVKQDEEWKIVHEHWSRFPESQMLNAKQQPILL
jgi:ketosteroid isomerase-like protein